MNTEELIEQIIDVSYPIYKKHSKGCIEALKLDRHEEVDIDGKQTSQDAIPLGWHLEV